MNTVTAAAPTASLAKRASALTPALDPTHPVAPLIGQRAAREYFSAHLQKGVHPDLQEDMRNDLSLTGLVGAKNGYETLGAAIDSAQKRAEANLPRLDKSFAVTGGAPGVVVEAGSRYYVMDTVGGYTIAASRLLGADNYRTFKTSVGDAVRAYVNLTGDVVRNNGKVGFWT